MEKPFRGGVELNRMTGLDVSARLNPHCRPPIDIFQGKHTVLWAVGCLAAYGYAFFALQAPVLEQWTKHLLVLAFAISVVYAPRPARTDPVVWVFLAAAALALFSYVKTNVFIRDFAESEPHFNKVFSPFLFFAVAWWLGGERRSVFRLLGVALIGFGIALLINATWQDVEKALRGARPSFGFQNWQHAAMFFSVALLGWVIFSVRFARAGTRRNAVFRYVLWGLVFVTLLGGVIVTQTRAAWLGLAVALVVGLGFLFTTNRTRLLDSRKALPLFILCVVAVAVVGIAGKPVVEKRLNAERRVIQHVMQGDFHKLPESSIGTRIKLWSEGLRWIKERPFTGWGYTIRDRYIADSPVLSSSIKKKYGHIHSSYLDIMLVYGMAGILLFGALVVTFAIRVTKAWRAGLIPADIMLFGICFFAYWLVVNLFESYIFGKTGTYLVALVGASLYTFPLAERQRLAAE